MLCRLWLESDWRVPNLSPPNHLLGWELPPAHSLTVPSPFALHREQWEPAISRKGSGSRLALADVRTGTAPGCETSGKPAQHGLGLNYIGFVFVIFLENSIRSSLEYFLHVPSRLGAALDVLSRFRWLSYRYSLEGAKRGRVMWTRRPDVTSVGQRLSPLVL